MKELISVKKTFKMTEGIQKKLDSIHLSTATQIQEC